MAVVRHKEVIHSGHFMVSEVDSRPADEALNLVTWKSERRNEASCYLDGKNYNSILSGQHQPMNGFTDTGPFLTNMASETNVSLNNSIDAKSLKSSPTPYGDLSVVPVNTKLASVEVKRSNLDQLLEFIKVVYAQKMICPKWNRFRGLGLPGKQRIRLNNMTWRCWYLQFVEARPRVMCPFADPREVGDSHEKAVSGGPVLEGQYWRRDLKYVVLEYGNWRQFYRSRYAVGRNFVNTDQQGHLTSEPESQMDKRVASFEFPCSSELVALHDLKVLDDYVDSLFETDEASDSNVGFLEHRRPSCGGGGGGYDAGGTPIQDCPQSLPLFPLNGPCMDLPTDYQLGNKVSVLDESGDSVATSGSSSTKCSSAPTEVIAFLPTDVQRPFLKRRLHQPGGPALYREGLRPRSETPVDQRFNSTYTSSTASPLSETDQFDILRKMLSSLLNQRTSKSALLFKAGEHIQNLSDERRERRSIIREYVEERNFLHAKLQNMLTPLASPAHAVHSDYSEHPQMKSRTMSGAEFTYNVTNLVRARTMSDCWHFGLFHVIFLQPLVDSYADLVVGRSLPSRFIWMRNLTTLLSGQPSANALAIHLDSIIDEWSSEYLTQRRLRKSAIDGLTRLAIETDCLSSRALFQDCLHSYVLSDKLLNQRT